MRSCMARRRARRRLRRAVAITTLALLGVTAGHGAARAGAEPDDPKGLWFALGALTGTAQPDANLADYQWDTKPHLAWGGRALVGRGRGALGLRVWQTQTTQQMDLSGVALNPHVKSTRFEFVGQGRLAKLAGMEVLAIGSVGRMHLGYDPDQVTIDSGGSGGPIDVRFEPVNEWIGGGGLAFARPVGTHWMIDLGVEHEVFALDTAHRNGSEIEYRRESFHEWNARLGFARLFQKQ